MRFSVLAGYLERLENTPSRNAMTSILAELLARADADEADKLCYLLLGELAPAYRGIDFQIAEKMMLRVLVSAYDMAPAEVLRRFKTAGDLGDVAYAHASGSGPAGGKRGGPSVAAAYDALYDIARESGEGSQDRKISMLADLLRALDPLSAKYVVRIPLGKLRLGFSDATLLDAFSFLIAGDKSARGRIERAYNVTADIGAIAAHIKRGGLGALARLGARPGIPIRPSLAERLQDTDAVIEKAGPVVAVEPKLDGFRTQIHVWEERGVRRAELFSRNLERTTDMFPEIASAARKMRVKSAILDAEAIGYHPETGNFALFQETVQRKRKHDIAATAAKIPLVAFVFDIMYLDGIPLIALPFVKRRRRLEDIFKKKSGEDALRLAERTDTDSVAVVRRELERNIGRGLEGIVVKNLAVGYEAGSRGFHWIKLKEKSSALARLRAGDSHGGLVDTIDCVVMGAYRGRGKRAQFGVGGFLLGVRGPDDRYYTISRLGTGLSDDWFREARHRIRAHEMKEKPRQYVVDDDTAPDIWIAPSLVVEILADEITRSPRHTAGRDADGAGYSLRFPRLVRFRDDKKPEDATLIEEIVRIHGLQKNLAPR
jgi:DNA ligase-1